MLNILIPQHSHVSLESLSFTFQGVEKGFSTAKTGAPKLVTLVKRGENVEFFVPEEKVAVGAWSAKGSFFLLRLSVSQSFYVERLVHAPSLADVLPDMTSGLLRSGGKGGSSVLYLPSWTSRAGIQREIPYGNHNWLTLSEEPASLKFGVGYSHIRLTDASGNLVFDLAQTGTPSALPTWDQTIWDEKPVGVYDYAAVVARKSRRSSPDSLSARETLR